MSDPVAISVAIYRRLLFLYPAKHRREFGDAMTQLFRDQCRDAWAARRWFGLCVFWLRALFDLGKTALREHLAHRLTDASELQWRTVRLVFLAVFLLIAGFAANVAFLTQPKYASRMTIEVMNPGHQQAYEARPGRLFIDDTLWTNVWNGFYTKPPRFYGMARLLANPQAIFPRWRGKYSDLGVAQQLDAPFLFDVVATGPDPRAASDKLEALLDGLSASLRNQGASRIAVRDIIRPVPEWQRWAVLRNGAIIAAVLAAIIAGIARGLFAFFRRIHRPRAV